LLERPRNIIILIILWSSLSLIFLLWASWSLSTVLDIPEWINEVPSSIHGPFSQIVPIIHFGYLMSTIFFFVFSAVFIIISYGTFKNDSWVWTTSLILTTIFLAVFALMLASFIINVLIFRDDFSIEGLTTVIITLLIDLGIIFYLTRPKTKLYFGYLSKK